MTRARTILTGGALVLAAGLIAMLGLWLVQPAAPVAAPSAKPTATAEITRGNLRDTKTVTGTLSYGALSGLRPSLDADTAMVTWLAPVGSTIERGAPLYALAGQPAILFYGTVPQHRTLRFAANASPVWVELEQSQAAADAAELTLQLEEARLADADARTASIGARLRDALLPVPVTAEFIPLAGAVRAAEAKLARVQKLSAAELTPSIEIAAAETDLATARATLDAATRALRRDLAAAGLDAATARVAVAAAEVKLDAQRSALAALMASASDTGDVTQLAGNLTALGYEGSLAAEVLAWQRAAGLPVTGIVAPRQLVIAAGPTHIAAHNVSVGDVLDASSPGRGSILDFSSTIKQVAVPLAVADQALAAVGRVVIVTLPDDTEIEGTISEVGSVVTDGTIAVTITIADQAALGGLEVAAVDVEFVSDSRDDVLSVPVTALLARPAGGFAVEMVTGGASALVPVETGLFAAERVEVSGDGIAEGMLVGVPG